MSAALDLLQEVRDRLRADTPTPPVIPDVESIRLDHRTEIPREAAPAVHIEPIDDTTGKDHAGCNWDRELAFRVSVFVRDDAGYAAADPILAAIMAKLNPQATAYQHLATLAFKRLRWEQEIADADALRVDMIFSFDYNAATWALE